MALRFDESSSGEARFRRPPNYFKRSTQLRMLVLVFALMFVLVAMFEARKPKYYRWMGFQDARNEQGAAQRSTRSNEQPLDTRVRPSTAPRINGPLVKMARGANSEPRSEQAESDFIRREVLRAWTEVLAQLSTDDRRRLDQVLRASLRNQNPPPAKPQSGLVDALNAAWQQLHQRMLGAVLEMPDENQQKPSWLWLLQHLETHWEQLRSPLAAAEAGQPLAEQDFESLRSLEKITVQIALQKVRDRTVLSRGSEHEAWFRLWDRLGAASPDELRTKSQGKVGFLQLFRQPETYRGKLVTVAGSVRMAYYVDAPENRFAVEGYYVLVLLPAGGPSSPMLVYSLELPDGFPAIGRRPVEGLAEEVEIDGIFFKNCVYAAHDGARLAPLMLGKLPTWEPPAPPGETVRPPSSVQLGIALAGVGLASVLIAVWVYRQTN